MKATGRVSSENSVTAGGQSSPSMNVCSMTGTTSRNSSSSMTHEKFQEKRSQHGGTPGIWSNFGYTVKIADFGICFVDKNEISSQLKVANAFGLSYP